MAYQPNEAYSPWTNGFINYRCPFPRTMGENGKEKPLPQKVEELCVLEMCKMYRRLSRMFKWKNLPDTITARYMELLIMTRGYAGIVHLNGKEYCVFGSLGGTPNWEYMPSSFIVTNPFLKLDKNEYNVYGDNKDCVIIPNNSLYMSLNPQLSVHASILTDITLTKRAAYIRYRDPDVFLAHDANAQKNVRDYLYKRENGEVDAILDKNFMFTTEMLGKEVGGRNIITQLLEAEQYQKAAMFNDFGLQLNYNMKRESITSSEAQLGEGALLPDPDDMMEMRQVAVKEWNALWGRNISVEFDSAWRNLRVTIESETAKEAAEVEKTEAEAEAIHSNGEEAEAEAIHSNGEEEETTPEEPNVEHAEEVVEESEDEKTD